MSGTRSGAITTWDDAQGSGTITEGTDVQTVGREDCSVALQNALKRKAIPPDPSVQVTFDLDLMNEAIDVDLG